MESAFALVTLFSALILIASTTDARPDPGSVAGVGVQDKPVQGLFSKGTSVIHVPNTKTANCHKAETDKKKPFVNDDFEPRPNMSTSYDEKLTEERPDDFEPRPNVAVYDNGVRLKNGEAKVDDFKPREVFWVYKHKGNNLKNEKGTNNKNDFDPRPNVSVYDNGIGLKDKKVANNDDFEPRPNVSVYDNGIGLKDKKVANNDDSEPRPNVSVYDNGIGLKDKKVTNNDDFEPRPNVSVYDNGIDRKKEKEGTNNDFEPKPDISTYNE